MENRPGYYRPAVCLHAARLLAVSLAVALLSTSALGQPADSVAIPLSSDARFKVDLLLVVAHPDDESAFAGYLARSVLDEGRTAAVVYLFDGKGGQSVEGTEGGEALGAIRQIEARAALAELGISRVWFLGERGAFSSNVLKSLAAANHGALLERLIVLVRLTRPEVVLTWVPAAVGDHADHQASGVLATEAFSLSGDPAAYPAQLAVATTNLPPGGLEYGGLRPWQPKRLYFVTDGSGVDLEALGPAYALTDVSPSRDISYGAIAAESAAKHRSQEGFAGLAEALDRADGTAEALQNFEAFYGFPLFPDPTRFILGASRTGAAPKDDLFAGLTLEPIPFSPPEREDVPVEQSSRIGIQIGGPWAYYRAFWAAYGLGHLADLRAPSARMRPDEPYLRVPLLLINPTSQRRVIRVAVALPAGWAQRPGVGSFEVAPHTTIPIEGRLRPADGEDAVPGKAVWEAYADGASVGSVTIEVVIAGGLPQ